MEHMPSAQSDHFAEMHAGTAADHYMLGMSHLKHAMKLTIFGSSAGGSRPHTGADVQDPGADTDDLGTLQEQNAAKGGTNGVFLPIHAWKELWDSEQREPASSSIPSAATSVCLASPPSSYTQLCF